MDRLSQCCAHPFRAPRVADVRALGLRGALAARDARTPGCRSRPAAPARSASSTSPRPRRRRRSAEALEQLARHAGGRSRRPDRGSRVGSRCSRRTPASTPCSSHRPRTRTSPRRCAPPGLAARRSCVVATSVREARAGADGGRRRGRSRRATRPAGWVGEESTFVLLQRLRRRRRHPRLGPRRHRPAHGRRLPHVAGAAGVVLDAQLLLARESPLPEARHGADRRAWTAARRSCLGAELGAPVRRLLAAGPGAGRSELRAADRAASSSAPAPAERAAWRDGGAAPRVGWDGLETQRPRRSARTPRSPPTWRRRFVTVGGHPGRAARRRSPTHVRSAAAHRARSREGAPLARVARHALPDRPGPDDPGQRPGRVRRRGRRRRRAAVPRPRADARARGRRAARARPQRAARRPPVGRRHPRLRPARAARRSSSRRSARYRPPFALIAGGRPDQARALEADGIATYLHVPSPGPAASCSSRTAPAGSCSRAASAAATSARASSFVLWDAMVERAARRAARGADAGRAATSCSPAASTTPARRRWSPRWPRRWPSAGVARRRAAWARPTCSPRRRSRAGAITRRLPGGGRRLRRARCCSRPAPATRPAASPTPFADAFRGREAPAAPRGHVAARSCATELEQLNLGRLRIAIKGLDRDRAPAATRTRPLVDGRRRRAVARAACT